MVETRSGRRIHMTVAEVAELGSAIFRDPADGSWQTADAYLSGPVRDKLKTAEAAAALDADYARNVTARPGSRRGGARAGRLDRRR